MWVILLTQLLGYTSWVTMVGFFLTQRLLDTVIPWNNCSALIIPQWIRVRQKHVRFQNADFSWTSRTDDVSEDRLSLNSIFLCLSLFLISSSSICRLHLVTMQIYLKPLSRRTGSTETPTAALVSKAAAEQSKAVDGRSPAFAALVQKSSCQNFKSPVKSPSQYFQICYWRLAHTDAAIHWC